MCLFDVDDSGQTVTVCSCMDGYQEIIRQEFIWEDCILEMGDGGKLERG